MKKNILVLFFAFVLSLSFSFGFVSCKKKEAQAPEGTTVEEAMPEAETAGEVKGEKAKKSK